MFGRPSAGASVVSQRWKTRKYRCGAAATRDGAPDSWESFAAPSQELFQGKSADLTTLRLFFTPASYSGGTRGAGSRNNKYGRRVEVR